jgi:hypothetical protein
MRALCQIGDADHNLSRGKVLQWIGRTIGRKQKENLLSA